QHRFDLAAEHIRIIFERGFAIAVVEQIRIDLHDALLWLAVGEILPQRHRHDMAVTASWLAIQAEVASATSVWLLVRRDPSGSCVSNFRVAFGETRSKRKLRQQLPCGFRLDASDWKDRLRS